MMLAVLFGAAVAGGWWLVGELRRRGFTSLGLETGLMVCATVLYAVMLAGYLGLSGALDKVSAGLNGYGLPVTHWLPHVPRPLIITGAFFAVGIACKIARGGSRRRPGRSTGAHR